MAERLLLRKVRNGPNSYTQAMIWIKLDINIKKWIELNANWMKHIQRSP